MRAVNTNGTLLKTSQEYTYTIAEAAQMELFADDPLDIRISNPVHEQLNISVDGSLPRLKLTIGSMSGRVLLTRTYGVIENQKLMVPVGSLAPGVYWIKLETGVGPAQSRKFIKLKHY